ncbi:hypothetical protein ACFYR1_51250 [Streptomyces canus]|uniref:hypothetical protein n=1 Tax=Streptomyces canus TaxID=58343 RepID=UPI0036879E9E
MVFDGLGGAVGDLLDVQAQPYAAGAFTVGRKAALQFVVETPALSGWHQRLDPTPHVISDH